MSIYTYTLVIPNIFLLSLVILSAERASLVKPVGTMNPSFILLRGAGTCPKDYRHVLCVFPANFYLGRVPLQGVRLQNVISRLHPHDNIV